MLSIKSLTLCGDSMKNVIFSIYVDIDDSHLETLEGYRGDDMSRSHRTKQQLFNYRVDQILTQGTTYTSYTNYTNFDL